MAKKNNIRSIRYSDDIAELIDRQIGDTFTEKFENLVTRCVWELPEKERQLKELDKQIKARRKELETLAKTATEYSDKLNTLKWSMDSVARTIGQLEKLGQ